MQTTLEERWKIEERYCYAAPILLDSPCLPPRLNTGTRVRRIARTKVMARLVTDFQTVLAVHVLSHV